MCVTNDHLNHNPVISSFMSYHRFVSRVTRCVPHVNQELPTLLDYASSLLVISGIRVTRYLYLLRHSTVHQLLEIYDSILIHWRIRKQIVLYFVTFLKHLLKFGIDVF